ncbi:MAG TPA: MoxR family ATPase, partial [Azospira sp.]|nr:MoxR family ATPase [Azospira sp.]
HTYPLPPVFMVLATQNPIEMAGTYVLPEAQLDRFFMRLSTGYPSPAEEARIIRAQAHGHPIERLQPVLAEADLQAAREAVRAVHVDDTVADYVARIVAASRQHEDLRLGASPRGTLALCRAAQGLALLQGRDFVTPDMVKAVAHPVLAHRLILRPQAAAQGRSAAQVLAEILDQVPAPV